MELDTIHLGDCSSVLTTFPDNSVDFIFTSPALRGQPQEKPTKAYPFTSTLSGFFPYRRNCSVSSNRTGLLFLNIKESAAMESVKPTSLN